MCAIAKQSPHHKATACSPAPTIGMLSWPQAEAAIIHQRSRTISCPDHKFDGISWLHAWFGSGHCMRLLIGSWQLAHWLFQCHFHAGTWALPCTNASQKTRKHCCQKFLCGSQEALAHPVDPPKRGLTWRGEGYLHWGSQVWFPWGTLWSSRQNHIRCSL